MDDEPRLKLTRDDRRFLRQCGIDPEDGYVRGRDTVISAALARAVIREFGQLNAATLAQYMGYDIEEGGN